MRTDLCGCVKCDYMKCIFMIANQRVLPHGTPAVLTSSQTSWKVEITLNLQEKLAASPLEFSPVEPAELPEGSQSMDAVRRGPPCHLRELYHWEQSRTGVKGAFGRSEVGLCAGARGH